MSATSQTVDAALAAVGSKSTYAGASVRHRLTNAEIRLREAQEMREREEHAAKMELYR
jgi:hypothetical protein